MYNVVYILTLLLSKTKGSIISLTNRYVIAQGFVLYEGRESGTDIKKNVSSPW